METIWWVAIGLGVLWLLGKKKEEVTLFTGRSKEEAPQQVSDVKGTVKVTEYPEDIQMQYPELKDRVTVNTTGKYISREEFNAYPASYQQTLLKAGYIVV